MRLQSCTIGESIFLFDFKGSTVLGLKNGHYGMEVNMEENMVLACLCRNNGNC